MNRPTTRGLSARVTRLETMAPGGKQDAPAYVCLSAAEYERLADGELVRYGCKVYVGVCPDDWSDP